MNNVDQLKELEEKLSKLDLERSKLIVEINSMRGQRKQLSKNVPPALFGRQALNNPHSSPKDKIDLFLNLFRCREDVYPKRWENSKTGKQGYSPACELEWVKPTFK